MTYARSLPILALMALWLAGGSLVATAQEPAPGSWVPFAGGPETTCADGSEVNFLERVVDPERVVLYFEGGGGCFSASTCAFDGEERSYRPRSEVTAAWLSERGGIFDAEHPQNPVAGYSFVYAPYCTGDVHLGTRTHEYAPGVVVDHRGFDNASAALDHLVEAYPGVRQLLVAGSSAGSIPTPLFAALAADRLPDTKVVTLGDGSGAYPDDEVLNAYVGSLWGSGGSIPDWPETEGLGVGDWSIPGLYVYAGRHAPDVIYAKFDYAYDETQAFYANLVGVEADDLVSLIDQIDADIESAGVEIASFVAPGSGHTILGDDAFYELVVDGARLRDWVSDLVTGKVPPDVHCLDCR